LICLFQATLLRLSSSSFGIEMRAALDFHGSSGGSQTARQGLSRRRSSSEMLRGGDLGPIWERAFWYGSSEFRLSLPPLFFMVRVDRIVECLCIQGAWTEQRFPLSSYEVSGCSNYKCGFGCGSGGYRVAGYRQQRHPGVGLSSPDMDFSCRFL
ncbi:unnamed protein product, partial [Brassica oleracea]